MALLCKFLSALHYHVINLRSFAMFSILKCHWPDISGAQSRGAPIVHVDYGFCFNEPISTLLRSCHLHNIFRHGSLLLRSSSGARQARIPPRDMAEPAQCRRAALSGAYLVSHGSVIKSSSILVPRPVSSTGGGEREVDLLYHACCGSSARGTSGRHDPARRRPSNPSKRVR